MTRKIKVDGKSWTATNTGWAHEVAHTHSTHIRLTDEGGAELFGRLTIEPEKIDSVTDEDLAEALRISLRAANEKQ